MSEERRRNRFRTGTSLSHSESDLRLPTPSPILFQRTFAMRDHCHLHTGPVDPPQLCDVTRRGISWYLKRAIRQKIFLEVSAGKLPLGGAPLEKLMGTFVSDPWQGQDRTSLLLQRHVGCGKSTFRFYHCFHTEAEYG
jgi:hypothetical protein